MLRGIGKQRVKSLDSRSYLAGLNYTHDLFVFSCHRLKLYYASNYACFIVKNWVQIFTNLFQYSSLIMAHLLISIFSSLTLLQTSILLQ